MATNRTIAAAFDQNRKVVVRAFAGKAKPETIRKWAEKNNLVEVTAEYGSSYCGFRAVQL